MNERANEQTKEREGESERERERERDNQVLGMVTICNNIFNKAMIDLSEL